MPYIDELSALALEAIRTLPTDEERETAGRPPYPTPKCHLAFEKAARAARAARLEKGGDDPMCSTRLFEPAVRFSTAAALELSRPEGIGLDVSDMLCLLLAGGAVSVATAETAISGNAFRLSTKYLCRAGVYRLLVDGDEESAKAACDRPVMGCETWVNWRAVGEYYAMRADVKSFLSLWKKYSARQERFWMDTMRRALVEAVSKAQGWREAVKLTRRGEIGSKAHELGMIYVALSPVAATGDTAALRKLFETGECPAELSEIAKLWLLLDVLSVTTPHPPQFDPPELGEIIARIVAVDPTVSKQQSRNRDLLLMECWPLIGGKTTLERVRAAIRAPVYKRELKRLAKELDTE
ncbi:MAG: hypothetical protein LBP78_07380 [Acidaminococcales bacterium]|jgi:hypothetical protein|nr:hypothetical protein [Acidaminococcales bacterium]